MSYRANPRFQQQSQEIQTVSILSPEVKVYQIDAGGVREEITEWSTQARTNVVSALDSELRANMKTEVAIISEESLAAEKERAKDARALYAAVSAMVLLHTYPNPKSPGQLFEEKPKNFDYSLGTEVASLAKGADALLFIDAQDHVWTAGRQALQALGAILGVGAGVATGVVIIPVMSGGTNVRAALVDSHTGDVLWINVAGSGRQGSQRPGECKRHGRSTIQGFSRSLWPPTERRIPVGWPLCYVWLCSVLAPARLDG